MEYEQGPPLLARLDYMRVDPVAQVVERALSEQSLMALGREAHAVAASLQAQVGPDGSTGGLFLLRPGASVVLLQKLPSHLGQIGSVGFFIYCEVQVLVDLVQAFLAHEVGLHGLDELPQISVLHQFEELAVLGGPVPGAEQFGTGVELIAFGDRALGFGQHFVHELHLLAVEPVHYGLEDFELVRGYGSRARYDEGRSSLVYENAVHLVHDSVVMLALHAILEARGHIVPEVVETELIIGPVSDIGPVGLVPVGVHHVMLYATHGEAHHLVDSAHPLGIAPREVVVHGHQMRPPPRERVEVKGHGRDQRLALACRHLGYLALVQDDRTKDLNVEGHHVPCGVYLADRP